MLSAVSVGDGVRLPAHWWKEGSMAGPTCADLAPRGVSVGPQISKYDFLPHAHACLASAHGRDPSAGDCFTATRTHSARSPFDCWHGHYRSRRAGRLERCCLSRNQRRAALCGYSAVVALW